MSYIRNSTHSHSKAYSELYFSVGFWLEFVTCLHFDHVRGQYLFSALINQQVFPALRHLLSFNFVHTFNQWKLQKYTATFAGFRACPDPWTNKFWKFRCETFYPTTPPNISRCTTVMHLVHRWKLHYHVWYHTILAPMNKSNAWLFRLKLYVTRKSARIKRPSVS